MADESFPTFTPAEYARRHAEVRRRMSDAGLDGILVYGAGSSAQVHYLTNWLTTIESYLLFPLEGEPVLFVQLSNHMEAARKMAVIDDVRFGGRRDGGIPATLPSLVAELTSRGYGAKRLGYVGRVPWSSHQRIHDALPGIEIADFTAAMSRQMMTKSDEEIARIREASRLSDLSVLALADELRPGINEYEICKIIEDAYLGLGGVNGIHYILTTSMRSPDGCIPRQYPTGRTLSVGDMVVVEISTKLFGYSGQILRTYTIGEGPTPEVAAMHQTAEGVYDEVVKNLRAGSTVRDVLAAAELVHERGYTIGDDLLHGANQLPPIVRTSQTGEAGGEDFVFESGMCVVVQPNIVTLDRTGGVQFGEMLVIQDGSADSLHTVDERLIVCAE